MAWIIVIGTVLIALIAGLGTAAVFRWREEMGLIPVPIVPPVTPQRPSSAPKRLSTLVAQIQPEIREEAGVVFHSPDETHRCPTCAHTFVETLVMCPFDGSLLEPFLEPPQHDNGCCPDCARTFEPSARFCYVDGKMLSNRVDSFSATKTFHACEGCGTEWTDDEHRSCGCMDAPTTISKQLTQAPLVPISKCKQCGYVGAQSQLFCPNDGRVLEPIVNIHHEVFPASGFGPMRAICPDCGTSHGRNAKYCSRDGAVLILLN